MGKSKIDSGFFDVEGASESKFRLAFENSATAIVWADCATGVIIDCNPAAERLFDRSKFDMIGCSQTILHPPALHDSIKQTFQERVKHPGSLTETQIVTKAGKIREVIISTAVTDIGGKKIIQGIFTDITEKKKVTSELDRSEERFRMIYHKSPIGIELYDGFGNLVDVNPACLQIFGVQDVEDVRGFNLFADPNVPEEQKQRIREGYPVSYESIFDFDVVKKDSLYNSIRSGKCIISCTVIPLRKSENFPGGYLVHVHEITERKIAEKALRDSHRLLSGFLDNIKGAAYVKDRKGRYLLVNKGFEDLYGKPRQEILGKDATCMFEPMSAAATQKDDARIIRTKKPEVMEDTLKIRGTMRTLVNYKAPLIDEEGRVYGICGIDFDITPQKEMEKELLAHRTRLEELIKERTAALRAEISARKETEWMLARAEETAHLGSWEMDLKTKKLVWSDELFRIFGFRPQEFEPKAEITPLHTHPDDRQAALAAYTKSVKEHKPYDLVNRIIRQDGSIRWVHGKGSYDRRTGKLAGSVIDITEQKESELALQNSEEKYRKLAESIKQGLFTTDKGKFTYVNDAMTEIFGYSRKELMSMYSWMLAVPEIREKVKEGLFKKVADKDFSPTEALCISKGGRRFPVEIRMGEMSGRTATGLVTPIQKGK